MNTSPLKNYGFTYHYKNSEYMLDVVAHSEDEAKERVMAMAGAVFGGELHEVPNVGIQRPL